MLAHGARLSRRLCSPAKSVQKLFASATTQSVRRKGYAACSDEWTAHMWKSSEGEYAAELSSGKWVTSLHTSAAGYRMLPSDRSAEVVHDTKPAGFDERIEYSWYAGSEDALSSDQLDEAQRVVARAFVDAVTFNCVRGKWLIDHIYSIEEAAQMLEREALSLRALSKKGWKALQSDDDFFNLYRPVAVEMGSAGGQRNAPASLSRAELHALSKTALVERVLELQRELGAWNDPELKYILSYPEHDDLPLKYILSYPERDHLPGRTSFYSADIIDFEGNEMEEGMLVEGKCMMDGASSIEEAAQMLEAEAESLRALYKEGWQCLDDPDEEFASVDGCIYLDRRTYLNQLPRAHRLSSALSSLRATTSPVR